jgi:hypothetical protein
MMLLKLTGTGFPTEIGLVDSRDEQVHLITWNVLEMKIASFFLRMKFVFNLGLRFAFLSLSFFQLQSSRYIWAIRG